jgi:hypothetical protein
VTWLEVSLVLVAGLWAGTINAVVGSGTLVTFPTLVALGYPPLTATVSNAIGLVAGGVSGAWGYRRELRGQGRRLALLVPASVVGGVIGASLLLHLPESAFEAVVPVLIVLALVLVAVVASTLLISVYGGYFTAAQGILLVAVLGSLLDEGMQRLNGLKNVLTLVVNLVAATSYVLFGADRIDWTVAGLIAVSSLVGGALGARYGRRLPPVALRAAIVVLGTVALLRIVGAQAGWW